MTPITIAVLGGLGSAFGYGVADIFAKKGIDRLGHYKSLVYVYAFSFIFSFPLLLIDHTIPALNLKSLLILASFALADFIAYTALYKSYAIGKVSVLNPITSTYAVLSAVISGVFFGEIFNIQKTFSLILVMVGIVFASVDFKELRDGFQSKDLAKGVPLASLVFLIYGIYVPLWDRFIEGQGWVILSLIGRFFLFIFGYFAAKHVKKIKLRVADRRLIFWLLMVGLLEGFAAASFNWGISNSDQTSIVAAVGSAYPLILVVSAYFFLKERLAKNQYLGASLIVLGVVLVALA
jgi:drug/metabolite transporter (DMT)-like permease